MKSKQDEDIEINPRNLGEINEEVENRNKIRGKMTWTCENSSPNKWKIFLKMVLM